MAVLDLLFPPECAGCGRPGRLGCATCRAELACPATLTRPRPCPPGLPPTWAVSAYAGACREFLLAYKERGAVGVRAVLAVPLAAAIEAAARDYPAARVLVVPVPSARRAIRERGDDVVLGLTRSAASIARRAAVPVRVTPVLRHGRRVADSAGLGARDRAANLAGAFEVAPRLRRVVVGMPVVIADDLVTTGATIAEAARGLRGAGAVVIGAATVAATRRRGESGLLGGARNGATVGANR